MLTLIALAALFAWMYLAFFHGSFWRGDQRLDDAPAPERWPDIVAVIPARNEAETIGEVIAAHLKADYPGAFSLVLVDDQSSDATAEIALKAASADDPARALTVIRSEDLPADWTGKLWAVHQGLEKANDIAPDAKYVLLTDADIVLTPQTLRQLVAKAERENLALASLMARLDANGLWAGLLIPAFVFFFQKLYPFTRVNDPGENAAAAAGGVMLVRKDALAAIGGVQSIRGALIDDCALARRIKDITPTTKIWLGLADDEAVSRRDNGSLGIIWNMVARSAYAQLGRSPFLLAATVIGMIWLYLAPPLIALGFAWHHHAFAMVFALAAWTVMARVYWRTLQLYDQEPWQSTLLPIAGALYTAMTISSALQHWRGRGGAWKGRYY